MQIVYSAMITPTCVVPAEMWVLTVWQPLFVDNGENQNSNTYEMLWI